MKYKIDNYIKNIKISHELVARKLRLAQRQLTRATTVEEYQQIGILIRDSWIEFTKKLFSPSLVPAGITPPSPADVKGMLSYVFTQWPNCSEKLRKSCENLLALSIEIYHRTSIDKVSTEWCVVNTAMAMALLLELDSQSNQLASRRYYTCPTCGSLNLSVTRDREVDYDGPGPEFESWECGDCDWEHFIYLG